jgi:hypothetical protein
MLVIGLDVHKDSVAAVAVDHAGRQVDAGHSTILRTGILRCWPGLMPTAHACMSAWNRPAA